MAWLARHRPDIDWLNRTVSLRDIDVDVVLSVLIGPTSTWQHGAIVDPESTTRHTPGMSDGSSRVIYSSSSSPSSVYQWFLSQESSPHQRLRASHGRQRLPCVYDLPQPRESSGISCVTSEQWIPCAKKTRLPLRIRGLRRARLFYKPHWSKVFQCVTSEQCLPTPTAFLCRADVVGVELLLALS